MWCREPPLDISMAVLNSAFHNSFIFACTHQTNVVYTRKSFTVSRNGSIGYGTCRGIKSKLLAITCGAKKMRHKVKTNTLEGAIRLITAQPFFGHKAFLLEFWNGNFVTRFSFFSSCGKLVPPTGTSVWFWWITEGIFHQTVTHYS